jgi:MSHA biogenesis protein MshK
MKHLSSPYLAMLLLASTAHAAASEHLADPTRPAHAKAPAPVQLAAELRLEAVLKSGERHVAIVNGKIVRAGDRIGGALIEEISSHAVRYTRGGQSQVLRLQEHAMQVRRNVAKEAS